MRMISEQELKDILDKHGKWLSNYEGGSRADLSYTNLSGANLYAADLSKANLREADLSRANLYGADLYKANLSGTNLYAANLYAANLYEANLSRADLYAANLYGANLSNTLLDGKVILQFQFQRHAAIWLGGDEIRIGCHTHTINYWLKHYETIGASEDYSPEEIKQYGTFIKLCAAGGTNVK